MSHPFQRGHIRDYVVPVVSLARNGDGFRMEAFLGTAFNIGTRGALLTARHVIEGRDNETLAVLYVDNDNEWSAHIVEGRELCPTADVALMMIGGGQWSSIIECSGTWQGASMSYDCWGYPDDARYDSGAVGRPDLVFTTGYVRRAYSQDLPGIRGNQFFEISEIAGSGSSGAPLIHKGKLIPRNGDTMWPLVGIYSMERRTEVHVDGVSVTREVPYAVREEAFRDWAPEVLGRSILDESRN
jgi:hypothetical protein